MEREKRGLYWAKDVMSVGEDEGVSYLLPVDEQEIVGRCVCRRTELQLEKRLVLLGWLIVVITKKSL